MRVGDLDRMLAEGGQEWPSDAPADATVGGVLASGASSPRRLKVGALRDTVLEAEVVTGDGRLVRSGARTVKNVTGYDLHKLVVGSLGTLGVIVQVALKVRPLPERRRSVRVRGGVDAGAAILAAVPTAAAVLVATGGVELRLEGWSEEVDEQTRAASEAADVVDAVEDGAFPAARPWEDRPIVAEAAVPPSRLPDVLVAPDDGHGGEAPFGALAGVGIAWIGLDDEDALAELRSRAREAGGIAPAIRGPGGLGDAPSPAPEIQRRLKGAFDPNGVLAPGRGWGGL
jgi:glycolate oxidase FAD binding subunit